MSVRRPVIRYHGGKFGPGGGLARWVISHFPAHRVYVEPFGGAASVLMLKPRAYAEIYNDLAGDIVNVFRVLRDQAAADELRKQCELTPFSRAEFEQAATIDGNEVERARRTIFRSFSGFGSAGATSGHKTGFRANSQRSGTTAAHDWANYPSCIPTFVDRLRGVVLEHRPAAEVMGQQDSRETLHYVDPPYVQATRRNKREPIGVYLHDMADDDHRALADVLHGLRGMVVLSGYPSDLYDDLFGDWATIDRFANSDGGRQRTERLWLNPAAATGVRQPRLAIEAAE